MTDMNYDSAITKESGTAEIDKLVTKKSGGKKPQESSYSAYDLAGVSRDRFGVPPEIVTAAMRMEGKEKAALTEAKEIIERFMAREVK